MVHPCEDRGERERMLWAFWGHVWATELSPLHSTRSLILLIWHLPNPLRDEKNYYSRGERCQHSGWKLISSSLFPLLPPYKLWQRSALILETATSREQSVTVGPGPSAHAMEVLQGLCDPFPMGHSLRPPPFGYNQLYVLLAKFPQYHSC